jgi:hypothetical protein
MNEPELATELRRFGELAVLARMAFFLPVIMTNTKFVKRGIHFAPNWSSRLASCLGALVRQVSLARTANSTAALPITRRAAIS